VTGYSSSRKCIDDITDPIDRELLDALIHADNMGMSFTPIEDDEEILA